MSLLALRLFAVYAGATALILFLASRFIRPIRRRMALLLAAAPLLLVGKAFVTAGVYAPLAIAYDAPPLSAHRAALGVGPPRTPLLVDVVASYIPWRFAVREAIESGRMPLWNRFVLAGEPLLAVQEAAALHPFTWVGLLLPQPQAWTLEMALRLLLAFVCAYLFFAELVDGDVPALLGALAWGLSDFVVFHLGYPLAAAAAPLPLLLLAARRLAWDPGRRAVALAVVALVLVVLAGHPETLLHVVAAAGVWFVFELARVPRTQAVRPVKSALFAGVLALGLTAIALMPFFEILPHTREHALRSEIYARMDRSAPLPTGARLLFQNAMPYAFGVSGRGSVAPCLELPSGYAGALLFPMALVGLLSRRRERWALLLLGLVGAALHARLPGISDLVASLPLFRIALNERLAFLAAFAVAGLAVLGGGELAEGRGRRTVALASAAVAAVLLIAFAQRLARFHELGMPPDYAVRRVVLQVAPLVLLSAVIALVAKRRRRMILVAALVLLGLSRTGEAGGVYSTEAAGRFYPPLAIFDPIDRRSPWRTAPAGYVFPPNMPTMYGLEDVRGYVSLTLAPLAETFPIWCVPRPVEWNRVADPTKPFVSFLNVRWVFAPSAYAPPPGWEVLGDGPEGKLIENPRPLPRAFAPRVIRHETDPARELALLAEIADFFERGLVESPPPPPAARVSWIPNGPATVRVVRYLPDELSLEIDATSETVVGTSIPRWPGWKLTVDGVSRPLLVYNRAFLGFRAPAGRRRAILRYRPDGFAIGSAVSGGTLIACVLLLARRGRDGLR